MTGNTHYSKAIPNSLVFYASEPHACNYLSDRQALTVFADPKAPMSGAIYSKIIQYGFRRSGNYVYIPKCPDCDSCISVRIPVKQFSPSRNQKRNINLNSDLVIRRQPAVYNEKHFELYKDYINSRHQGGGMENPSPEDYLKFLTSSWSSTVFYEFILESQLAAVSVVDQLHDSLSAVYTFFDPQKANRGLGNYAILWLIKEAQKLQLPWLYLGYYIPNCAKMSYKDRYRPIEAFIQGKWRKFDRKNFISL